MALGRSADLLSGWPAWWSRYRHGTQRTSFGRAALDRCLDRVRPEDGRPTRSSHVVRPRRQQRGRRSRPAGGRSGPNSDHERGRRARSGHQRRLDAAARRAIDRERPAVAALEQLPQQRHRLVHDSRELRIELARVAASPWRAARAGSTLTGLWAPPAVADFWIQLFEQGRWSWWSGGHAGARLRRLADTRPARGGILPLGRLDLRCAVTDLAAHTDRGPTERDPTNRGNLVMNVWQSGAPAGFAPPW